MNFLKNILSRNDGFEFNDRIRLGDGVFDTMLVIIRKGEKYGFDACNVLPDLHFERLLSNAEAIGINRDLLPDVEDLIKRLQKMEGRYPFKEGRYAVNTIITRGPGQRGLMPPETPEPTINMRISPVPDEFPPIHAVIAETVRRNEGSPLSQIKSCNYGDNIQALLEAKEKNANDAILLNNAGNVTCASAGNIFACINEKLITPPLSDGVMDGVTRRILIAKLDVVEKSITAKDLQSAEGLYITNSIRGIAPVISLNGKTLPEPTIHIDKDFHIENH